jgi:hypothetical protein
MLWVHVAAVQRHCIETPKRRSESSEISEKGTKFGPPPPRYFCASVHSTAVSSCASYVLALGAFRFALFILSRLP